MSDKYKAITDLKAWYHYELKYQYEKKRDNLYLWLVGKLPKRLVMWCYVKVVAKSGNAPCERYKRDMELWGVK